MLVTSAISSSGELTFVRETDYENAADANGDNEYLVTVEADDDTYDSHAQRGGDGHGRGRGGHR